MSIRDNDAHRKPKSRNPFSAVYLAAMNGEAVSTPKLQEGLHFPDVIGLNTLEAALAYAKAGWYVLPTNPVVDIKSPGSVVGNGWQHKSSRDPEQIHQWFVPNPNYVVALHIGRSGAGAFDLDLDSLDTLVAYGRADLTDALRSAQAVQGTRLKGDRGHYIFAVLEGHDYGNSAGGFMPFGEYRGKNGVIIVTPTPHPDAETKGGDYNQRKTGPLSVMPEVLRAFCLKRPKAPTHSATQNWTSSKPHIRVAGVDATDAGSGSRGCEAITHGDGRGNSRYDGLVAVAVWAMSEAVAGCYPAGEAIDALKDTYYAAFGNGDAHERLAKRDSEFTRVMRWAAANADIERAHRNDDAPTDAELEAFWSAQPILHHIYESSLAQQMDPRGVLAVHLVRAICSIPPYVTIPGITAARASLNLHVALVVRQQR